MVTAVVGANWGDEGKGKITDMLAEKADIVIRFQGGANAGHTIINDYGRFALHTLPSGVFYDHTTSIIGNGVALDIPKLFKEIKSIEDGGVPTPKILVSDRAQMVMPYHVLLDSYEEERLAGASFGSTKSGIAPFYSDKYAKIGFQVSELFEDEKTLKEKIERVIAQKNVLLEHLYHKPLLTVDEVYATLMEYKQMVEPYVADVSAFLYQAMKDGKNVLLEGQLGSMKDPDHGIYPMVTSSSTLAGYGAIGAGIPPYEIKKIVVVSKAYSSAVGAGEFVSEIFRMEAMGTYSNATATAGMKLLCPYADTVMAVPMDYQRIRSGDTKYLVREVFGKLYPGFTVPPKTPMPRPMDEWLKNWGGPVREEFWPHCTDTMTGDQKWLVWILEKYFDMVSK